MGNYKYLISDDSLGIACQKLRIFVQVSSRHGRLN